MRRAGRILIVILLFYGRADGFAADKKPAPKKIYHTLTVDTGKLTIRHLDTAALNRYSRQPDFDYTHEKTEQQLSWWDRLWAWFWRTLARLLPRFSGSGSLVPFFKILIITAFAKHNERQNTQQNKKNKHKQNHKNKNEE